MDAEGSMEQNRDKNDAGTASHYPSNHHVDSRLLDTGRGGSEGNRGLAPGQAPAATGAHNQCFQQVQEDMCIKVLSRMKM